MASSGSYDGLAAAGVGHVDPTTLQYQKPKKHKGVAKRWNDQKGFGFIYCEDLDKEIFVHRRELRAAEALTEGDKVKFEIKMVPGDKLQAIKVDGGTGKSNRNGDYQTPMLSGPVRMSKGAPAHSAPYGKQWNDKGDHRIVSNVNICHRFLIYGVCQYGDRCKYHHVSRTETAPAPKQEEEKKEDEPSPFFKW